MASHGSAAASAERQGGFTLIELLVVVFSIAVLIGVAVPVLQGFRIKAQDRSAQTELRAALVLERVPWQEYGSFTNIGTDLKDYDFNFQEGDLLSKPYHPSFTLDASSSSQRLCMTQQSDSGTWYSIFEDGVGGRTYYGEGLPVPCNTALTSTYSENGW